MSSDVRLCKRCRKMFRFSGEPICDACAVELDDVFLVVRDYVDAHFSAGVKDILKDTDVNERDVLMLLREGRFQLNIPDGTITCERCSKPIAMGSICDACREKLGKTLQEYTQSASGKTGTAERPKSNRRSNDMRIDL